MVQVSLTEEAELGLFATQLTTESKTPPQVMDLIVEMVRQREAISDPQQIELANQALEQCGKRFHQLYDAAQAAGLS